MTQLEKLKIRLGISILDITKDDLLNMFLEDASNEILDYTNRDTILTKMEGLQRELAIIYFNKQGSEGESSRSEGGISVSYSTEIPESIKSRLKAFRLLKGVRLANASTEQTEISP